MLPMLLPVSALTLSAARPLFWTSSYDVPSPVVVQEDQSNRLIREYNEALDAHRFEDALTAANNLQSTTSQGQAQLATMRASALFGLKRDDEARQQIAKAHDLDPNSSDPDWSLFFGGLVGDRPEFAADALDRLIAKWPEAARDIKWVSLRYFLRNAPKNQEQRNDDRRVALAKIGYGGDRDERQWIAASAFRIYIDRGDFAGAAEQLKYIDDPQTVENMLIQRRYTPLWPQLEQLAGPHLEKVRASSFNRAKRAYDASPEDHEKLSGLAYAARLAGRNDDAIALRSKLPLTTAALATADEDQGWAINNVALALFDAGRHDEADKLFATLNEATIADSRWRVSMIINRIEELTTDGKYDRARTLLPVTEKSAAEDGSDFARQLVRRLKFCILSRSGLKEEAAKVLPDMLAHANDALEPTVSGLLCGGEVDKAEKLALEGLQIADKDKRREFELDFVRALQPVLLTSDDPSEWDNAWRALRQRPAIAAAYAKLGRDMPAELIAPRPKAAVSK